MIAFPVELKQLAFKFVEDGIEDGPQRFDVCGVEDLATPLAYEHQVNSKTKNRMPAAFEHVCIPIVDLLKESCIISYMNVHTNTIERKTAYKFLLEPTDAQEGMLYQFIGNKRFLFNKLVAMNFWRLDRGYKILSLGDMDVIHRLWKDSDEYGFLSLSPSHTLQQAIADCHKAFMDWFDKSQTNKGRPNYKKKQKGGSVRFPRTPALSIEDNQAKLPKLGLVKFRRSRRVKGEIRNITVSLKNGRWYMSVMVIQQVQKPVHQSKTSVGIDRGIAVFAAVTDGTEHTMIKPLNSFRRTEKKLAKAQRRLKNKIKFSSNWKRQQKKIARIHERIANQRADYLHKISTDISKSHAMIFVENLNVRGMSGSAKGTEENPGRNVRAKAGLNKAILDQGWGMFGTQLEYKAKIYGGDVMEVPARNTSRTCPCCRHVSADNRKTQADFVCVECGYAENADIVGALNVLARGHRVMACGGKP